ncbi:serine/threonine protein kinase, partial [Streptomyces sp. NPDC003233]
MNMAMMRLRREDPRVVGSFRLHRRLGAGGMGVVYLGSDKKGQRPCRPGLPHRLQPSVASRPRQDPARTRRLRPG